MLKKGGKIFVFIFLIILSGFFCFKPVGASDGNVIISEVCWMGSVDSANHEWIELKNESETAVNLEGWNLNALDGSPSISLSGTILPGAYFLLERTSDESVPSITADLIYTGALGNSGEEMELRDQAGNLVNFINITDDGWPAGDNAEKRTMERRSDGNWQTSLLPGGTPRAQNSLVSDNESDGESDSGEGSDNEENIQTSDSATSEESSAPTPIMKNKSDIIINEIYPNPGDGKGEREFIELYNRGEDGINLSGWRLENEKDQVYEFGRFDLLLGVKSNYYISPRGFLVIFRDASGLVLDNNGGEIKLFNFGSAKAKQTLKYKEAPAGYSYVDTKTIDLEKVTTTTKNFLLNSTRVGEWIWTRLPTPGKTNQAEPENTLPQISFSFPKNIVAGQNALFDSSDSWDEEGDKLSFNWDFGDGIKVDTESPSHVFLKSGVYKVKMEASDGKGISFLEKAVNVLGLSPLVDNENKANIISRNFSKDISWVESDKEDLYSLIDYDFFPPAVDSVGLVSIAEAKKLSAGTKVKITGSVVVAPGVFGTQYFYVAGSPGIKIYNYKKDFPEVSLGDLVEVEGELTEAGGEKYLKTKEASDIEIVGNVEPILPEKVDSRFVIEENLNSLIEIEGMILEKKNPRIYFGDEFGEIVVYIKSLAGIDLKRIKEGDKVKISGLLGKVSDSLVLLPRSDDDIVLLEEKKEEILPQKEIVKEWELPQGEENREKFKYLLFLLLIGAVVFGIVFYKKIKNKKDD